MIFLYVTILGFDHLFRSDFLSTYTGDKLNTLSMVFNYGEPRRHNLLLVQNPQLDQQYRKERSQRQALLRRPFGNNDNNNSNNNRSLLLPKRSKQKERSTEIVLVPNDYTTIIHDLTFFSLVKYLNLNPLDPFYELIQSVSPTISIPTGQSDHIVISVCASIHLYPQPKFSCQIWQYRSADWERLSELISSFHWSTICSSSTKT